MITLAALGVVLALQRESLASPRVLDSFERITAWSAHPADGVRMSLHEDQGHLRLDFSFAAGGYAVARRALPIDLPANYAFSIRIRGVARSNTLEFKLIDSTGDNVWWYTERDRDFDGNWHRLRIRKRQITFAWGPRGGGELARAAFLELVITAGKGGGSGSVWFDDLTLVPLPVVKPYTGTPLVTASQADPTHPAAAILDTDSTTAWRSGPVKRAASLTVDFGAPREFGGLTLGWEAGLAAASYDVWLSDDARSWRVVRRVRQGSATRTDHLYLPDSEGRYLRFTLGAPAARGYGLREVTVEPLEVGASRNAFFQRVTHTVPRGTYPRYFLGERTPWTVIGGDGSSAKGLINSDGAIDPAPGSFSLEPFLADSSFVTWNNVTSAASLEDGYLPIPSVTWTAGALALTVTASSIGPAPRPSLLVRYRLKNTGSTRRRPTLDLAVRPFQVNPPWQFLGTPGGVARVDSIRWTGKALLVGDRALVPLTPPSRAGVSTFDAGEIAERLRRGDLPGAVVARDSFGTASAVLAFRLDLPPGDSADVGVVVLPPHAAAADKTISLNGALAEAATRWHERLAAVDLTLPALPALPDAMRSSVGWILASRKGAALEPGTRAYDRSWIRDGALMSAALLRFGYDDVVRDYIEWYAPHQYPNGKIPCCVDARGADPVPEHDSNGEFIYLVMEYWRFTHDRALLERVWPRVRSAVDYLDSLRHTERVAPFVGLLPPSISHEGYSAKPMHSYWDDFFALRGFKDATAMAQVLGHDEEARRFARIRDEFSDDLHRSIDLAMSEHHIEYIPGAADLGDFDATSTTIALSPAQDASRLPRVALERTFVKYWDGATARRNDTTWDGYAGYEIRAVGAMLRLGWKSRALQLLQWFLDAREPPAWNQWPEVIYRDPRAPKFVGDMPHAWVAADFLRSASDLFAFEREADSALVIGAGLDSTWLADAGLTVSLRTWWGRLAYAARREEDGLHIRIDPVGGGTVPPGGIVVCSPLSGLEGAVVVRELPADIRFTH